MAHQGANAFALALPYETIRHWCGSLMARYNGVMRYRGHVKDGRIVPDPSISLPEGAEVRIEIVPGEISKEISQDQFRKWRGRGRLPHGLSVDDYLKQARDGDGN